MAADPPEKRSVDRDRLRRLIERERARYVADHPRSRELAVSASAALLSGVPMSFMGMLHRPLPPLLRYRARQPRGGRRRPHVHRLLPGRHRRHGGPLAAGGRRRRARQARDQGRHHDDAPHRDATWVGAELKRRFGLPYWQFALTATDANRWILRMCRMAQRRP